MSRKSSSPFRILLSALMFVMLTGCCFTLASSVLSTLAEQWCQNTLRESAQQLADTLNDVIHLHHDRMAVYAQLYPWTGNGEKKDAIVSTLEEACAMGNIPGLRLRLRDGTLYSSGTRIPPDDTVPSFEEDVVRLPYLSSRQKAEDGLTNVIYHALPIEQEGEVVGILYGYIDLDTLPDFLTLRAYGGQCQIYVVDGSNGDFLVDTLHPALGNAFDSILSDTPLEGSSPEAYCEDLRNGRAGYYAFLSEEDEMVYAVCYQPVGVSNWSIQLSLPETAVFAIAKRVQNILNFLGIGMTVIAALCLLVLVFHVRRTMRQDQQHLKQMQYMFEVQQLLFDAHKNTDRIRDALKVAAETLTADCAMLKVICKEHVQEVFISSDKGQEALSSLLDSCPMFMKWLASGHSLLHYLGDSISEDFGAELAVMRHHGIRSLMAVPIVDGQGELMGVLCACNMQERFTDCSFLECIAHSFMMALRNVSNYESVHSMSIMDTVTGLQNRNCYEQTLAKYADSPLGLHCLYIDANGLHQINNRDGHRAGDKMLSTVAHEIAGLFGTEHAYRVGGDEFVVFLPGSTSKIVADKLLRLKGLVNEHGYSISAGIHSQEAGRINVARLVTTAEQAMYQDKDQYYCSHPREDGRKNNQRLEALIQDKQDVDDFLAILTPNFLAAYIVNLRMNTTRVLLRSPNMETVLESNNLRFSESIDTYIREHVAPEDQALVQKAFRLNELQARIAQGCKLFLRYHRRDGSMVRVYVLPSVRYSDKEPESFWLFLKDGGETA